MTPAELERLRIQAPAARQSLPVVVRRKTDADTALVFDTWQRSVRSSRAYAQIPTEVWTYWFHLLVEGAWADDTMAWLLACNPEDPDQVYGWLCGQRASTLSGDVALLHYVYVKKRFRRFGLASRLLATFDTRLDQTEAVVVTQLTDAGRAWLLSRRKLYLYNPFLFWGRSPVPRPELGQRKMRKRNDPVTVAKRNAVASGFSSDEESDT